MYRFAILLCFCIFSFCIEASFWEKITETFSFSDDVEEVKEIDDNVMLEEAINGSEIQGIAKLAALNKVTAKSEKISIQVGESTFFGNIKISALKCIKSSELYNPTDKILVKVEEHRIDGDPEVLFHGWLFQNNLSISGLEHAVYELIAVGCDGE